MIRDFINARLNRDNFWNLMFFALFFVGIFVGLAVEQPFGGVVFFVAFIAAIILVRSNTQLIFDAEKLEFTTSQDKKIKTLGGVGFIWVLIISFFLALFPYGLFAKGTIFESLYNNLVYAFFFALIPSLYCILLNFPISVYFQKEALIGNGKACCHCNDTSTSMLHDHLPGNIWHSNYLDKRDR